MEGLFLNFIYSDMKYLKIFEGFDKDKFYQEISYNDYMSEEVVCLLVLRRVIISVISLMDWSSC